MKKTIKIVTSLLAGVLVILLAFVLLEGCGSSKVDKRGFYSKDIKTSKTSSSSSKSSTKSSSKKSSSTSSSTQADSSTEATSSAASVASSATTTAPKQEQAQTPSQPAPSQDNSANQAGTTTSESDPKTGYGGWEATSGTLTLTQDTPVYTEPNKDGGVAYVQPQGDIQWDKYIFANGDNWYSFVQKNRDQEVRFYIAYSDVGH
jgi:hypothetical protein